MTATLHRDNWEQYAAICEQRIVKLEAALQPLTKFADETRYARWRGLIPGSVVTVEEAERARDVLSETM